MKHLAMRSLLFVPANNARFVEKAFHSDADAIVLDLEDSILPEYKNEARCVVQKNAARLHEGGKTILVRINGDLGNCVRDIEVAISDQIRGLVLPKVRGPEHVTMISDFMSDVEQQACIACGGTVLVPLIETPLAYSKINDIVCSDPRISAVAFGDEDLSAALGCSPKSEVLATYKHHLIAAAAHAGCQPLGLCSSIAEFRNLDEFESGATRAKAIGLTGSFCIHPTQVAVLNRVFSPTADEIERARKICGAFEAASRQGLGAISVDGQMVDRPVLQRAQAILARAEQGLGL